MAKSRASGFVFGIVAFCVGFHISQVRVAGLKHEVQRLSSEPDVAQSARDEVLGTLTHELRTPLNAVLGWLQILRMDEADAALRNHALEVMERNAREVVRHLETLQHSGRG